MGEKPNLTQTVEQEFVKQNCLQSGVEVNVPKSIYEAYTSKDKKNKYKSGCSFPGGYISPQGQVFSDYKAFNEYSMVKNYFFYFFYGKKTA